METELHYRFWELLQEQHPSFPPSRHLLAGGKSCVSTPHLCPWALGPPRAITGVCDVRSSSFSWFTPGLSENRTTIKHVAAVGIRQRVAKFILQTSPSSCIPGLLRSSKAIKRASQRTQRLARPSVARGEKDPSQYPQKVISRTSTAGSQQASSSRCGWRCTNTKWEIAPALKRP